MVTDRPERIGLGLVLVAASALLLCACGSSDGIIVRDHYLRGVDHYSDGAVEAAVDEYRLALSDRPDDYRVHYNLGVAYHDLFVGADDPAEAARYADLADASYRKVLEFTPGNPRAITAIATLLRDRSPGESGTTAALAWLTSDAAKVDDSEEGKTLPAWTRGSLLFERGDLPGARQAWTEVLGLDQANKEAATSMARVLIDEGDYAGAQVVLAPAMEIHGYDFSLRLAWARAKLEEARGLDASTDAGRDLWLEARRRLRLAAVLSDREWRLASWLAEANEVLGDVEGAVRQLWIARESASDVNLRKAGEDPVAWHAEVERRLQRLYDRLRAGDRG